METLKSPARCYWLSILSPSHRRFIQFTETSPRCTIQACLHAFKIWLLWLAYYLPPLPRVWLSTRTETVSWHSSPAPERLLSRSSNCLQTPPRPPSQAYVPFTKILRRSLASATAHPAPTLASSSSNPCLILDNSASRSHVFPVKYHTSSQPSLTSENSISCSSSTSLIRYPMRPPYAQLD